MRSCAMKFVAYALACETMTQRLTFCLQLEEHKSSRTSILQQLKEQEDKAAQSLASLYQHEEALQQGVYTYG